MAEQAFDGGGIAFENCLIACFFELFDLFHNRSVAQLCIGDVVLCRRDLNRYNHGQNNKFEDFHDVFLLRVRSAFTNVRRVVES